MSRILLNTLLPLAIIGVSYEHGYSAPLVPIFEQYPDIRAIGMGGVNVSTANDNAAIFSNPAGIGSQDDSKLILRSAEFPNLTLGANTYSQKMLDIYTNPKNYNAIKDIEEVIASNDTKTIFARSTFFPTFTVLRFQFGLLADAMAIGHKTSVPNADTGASSVISSWQRTQVGPVLGFSVPHQKTGLSLGIATKYLWRASTSQITKIVAGQLRREDGGETKISHTKGFGIDLGILLNSPKKSLPNLGISIKNIGNSTFKSTQTSGEDETIKANLGIGLSWDRLPKTNGFGFVVGAEAQHINDSRLRANDKYHLGTEIFWGAKPATAPIAVRIGHNLRGVSYGASVDLIFLKIDISNEVTATDGLPGDYLDKRTYIKASVDLRM